MADNAKPLGRIRIDGKLYEVVEDLGYQGGYYGKAVKTGPNQERIAVKDGLKWRFWGPKDRA